jgi:hypothetical protein
MNETMDTILSEALDLMDRGLGVEEIAARYPARAAELRPLLLTAAALSRLADQPALVAEQRSKQAFLAAADHQATRPARATGGRLRRVLAPMLALLAVLCLAGAGIAGASRPAVPGDALYGAKRLVEDARLGLTGDPERAAALREQFRQERAREIEQLLAAGRSEAVSLTGPIEAMTGARWTVAGLPVVVSPVTVIDGRPAVGAQARIDGRTGPDAVMAQRVTILAAAAPQPTPMPTADNRPTTTAPTDDRPPATAATATATATAVAPTATSTTTPATVTPTAPPSTATPDNANDNGGDNANDNGGDDANDNGDNANDNGDDNANDNHGGGDDNENDNGDSSGSGSDGDNDNGDNSGSGGDNANDNGDDNHNGD